MQNILFIIRIKLEQIDGILTIQCFHIKFDLMCDSVIIFNEIKLWNDARMILELRLPDSEESFNGILHSTRTFTLMEYTFETFERCFYNSWCKII